MDTKTKNQVASVLLTLSSARDARGFVMPNAGWLAEHVANCLTKRKNTSEFSHSLSLLKEWQKRAQAAIDTDVRNRNGITKETT